MSSPIPSTDELGYLLSASAMRGVTRGACVVTRRGAAAVTTTLAPRSAHALLLCSVVVENGDTDDAMKAIMTLRGVDKLQNQKNRYKI